MRSQAAEREGEGSHPSERPVALAFRHLHFEDLGLLEHLLEQHGYKVTYVDVATEQIEIAQVTDAALLVVLGGPIGVHDSDTYPFLNEEKAAISARVAAGGPLLGICLGAQLIAEALGAPVRTMERKEIGFGPVELTAQGQESVLAALSGGVPVLHWHGDEFGIPSGAQHLAATPGITNNQAFTVGSTILATQFHLEAKPELIERWLVGHALELTVTGVSPAQLRADAAKWGLRIERAAEQVFSVWLAQLPETWRTDACERGSTQFSDALQKRGAK